MFTKNINIKYNLIGFSQEGIVSDLNKIFETLTMAKNKGEFEISNDRYVYNIIDNISIDNNKFYFISLVKIKDERPAFVDPDLNITELTLPQGITGNLYYALINIDKSYILSFAANSGNSVSVFKSFLDHLTPLNPVLLTPLYDKQVISKVFNLDYFKNINASLKFDNHDQITEFINSDEGTQLRHLLLNDDLNALKFDISLSSVTKNNILDNFNIKKFIKNLLTTAYCYKIIIKGGVFDGETETYNLIDAKITFQYTADIDKAYIDNLTALNSLTLAYKTQYAILDSGI